MESFYLLVPIALIFVVIALRLLFWALHNGQYDNLETEAHRILFDTEAIKEEEAGDDQTASIAAGETPANISISTAKSPDIVRDDLTPHQTSSANLSTLSKELRDE